MQRKILKFKLPDTWCLDIENASKIVHFEFRNSNAFVWAEMEYPIRRVDHWLRIAVLGTGDTIDEGYEYVGTSNRGPSDRVWHLYAKRIP